MNGPRDGDVVVARLAGPADAFVLSTTSRCPQLRHATFQAALSAARSYAAAADVDVWYTNAGAPPLRLRHLTGDVFDCGIMSLRERPGGMLSFREAHRLWGLNAHATAELLSALVALGCLEWAGEGSYRVVESSPGLTGLAGRPSRA